MSLFLAHFQLLCNSSFFLIFFSFQVIAYAESHDQAHAFDDWRGRCWGEMICMATEMRDGNFKTGWSNLASRFFKGGSTNHVIQVYIYIYVHIYRYVYIVWSDWTWADTKLLNLSTTRLRLILQSPGDCGWQNLSILADGCGNVPTQETTNQLEPWVGETPVFGYGRFLFPPFLPSILPVFSKKLVFLCWMMPLPPKNTHI